MDFMLKPYDRFYKCLYFKIQELVDQETYKALGDSAWSLFDTTLLSTMDRLRDRYKVPITINNWHRGAVNPFKDRGFRHPNNKTGAPLSAHKRGQAIDFDVYGMDAEKVRKDIMDHQEHLDCMFVTRIEKDVNWVHIETTNQPTRIQLFSP
jgi:hypothetical protein